MTSATLQDTSSEKLPDLSSDYPLTTEQTAELRRDGHVFLRGVCSPEEIAVYRPVINAAADKFNSETRPLEERDTYGKAFLQIMNLWARDEAVKKFTTSRRLAKIAADLLGVDGVRVYHDQALFKEPGGGPTPWHQDQYYWPLDTDNTITLWMPLVDIPAAIGTMTFGTKSHEMGYLGEFKISDESDRIFEQMIADNNMKLSHYGAMQAGDATWHKGWTLHGAPGNPTSTVREVMTIIYFADGTHVTDPASNANRQDDLHWWLPGLKPGDLAASPLNPLVYSRKAS